MWLFFVVLLSDKISSPIQEKALFITFEYGMMNAVDQEILFSLTE